MELLLKLDREQKTSLYLQVFKQLKRKIMAEEIKPNSKLPAIRVLADKLEINPATVVNAYDLLEKENLIYKKIGSGSYVAPPEKSFQNLDNKTDFDLLGQGQLRLKHNINFASATPSASLFPVDDFKYALNRVLERDQGEAFTYQKSQGYYPLRNSIQNYLQKQGIDSPVDRIQIVSGSQQAIDLLAKILLDYGDTVLVEDPTYYGALSAFRSRKARIIGIPLNDDGMDFELLEERLKKEEISFIYMMSNFQNPTGISWSKTKKERLLELAVKYDFMIIEDDCLTELYFGKDSVAPLKTYDRQERVIYIKSFSKIFMPGLRLAFLILPRDLLSPVLAAKYAADISCAGLNQRAFDCYLREGFWDKHLFRMRKLFKNRFQIMQEEIENELPAEIKTFYRPQGGLYFWLSLPDGLNAKEFHTWVLEENVAFLPGGIFSVDQDLVSFFRLSFAAVNETQIKEGMKIIGQVSKKILSKNNIKSSDKGFTPLL